MSFATLLSYIIVTVGVGVILSLVIAITIKLCKKILCSGNNKQ